MQFLSLATVSDILSNFPKHVRVCKGHKGPMTLAQLRKLSDSERCNLAKVVAKRHHYNEVLCQKGGN
jgi:hypothetical protein